MNIIKQTADELVLQSDKHTWRYQVFTILFFTPFIVAPLYAIAQTSYNTSSFTLSCNRVEPTQVTCEYTHYKLFGLIKEKTIPSRLVKEAKLTSEIVTDSEGDTTEHYSATLVYANGQTTVLQESVYDYEITPLTLEINSFINSNEPSLITERKSWNLSVWNWILGFAIMAFPLSLYLFVHWIAWLAMLSMFTVTTLTFNKKSNKLIAKNKSFIWSWTKHYKLNEITKIEQEEDYSEDDENIIFYKPTLILASGNSYTLLYTSDQEEARLRTQLIKSFLPHINS